MTSYLSQSKPKPASDKTMWGQELKFWVRVTDRIFKFLDNNTNEGLLETIFLASVSFIFCAVLWIARLPYLLVKYVWVVGNRLFGNPKYVLSEEDKLQGVEDRKAYFALIRGGLIVLGVAAVIAVVLFVVLVALRPNLWP